MSTEICGVHTINTNLRASLSAAAVSTLAVYGLSVIGATKYSSTTSTVITGGAVQTLARVCFGQSSNVKGEHIPRRCVCSALFEYLIWQSVYGKQANHIQARLKGILTQTNPDSVHTDSTVDSTVFKRQRGLVIRQQLGYRPPESRKSHRGTKQHTTFLMLAHARRARNARPT